MNHNKGITLIGIICLIVVLSFFITSQQSDASYGSYESSSVTWEYFIDGSGDAVIISASSEARITNLEIPNHVTDVKNKQHIVTEIQDYFIHNSKINKTNVKTITIPNTVKRIGVESFIGFSNLSSVIFENGSGLEYVGNGAFMNSGKLYEGIDHTGAGESILHNYTGLNVSGDEREITSGSGNRDILVEFKDFKVADSYSYNLKYGSNKAEGWSPIVPVTGKMFKITLDMEKVQVGEKIVVMLKSSEVYKFTLMVVSEPTDSSDMYKGHLCLSIPSSTKYIGSNSFNRAVSCSIGEDSVLESIGDYAFANVREPIFVPKAVSDIGIAAISPVGGVKLDPSNSYFVLDDRGNLTRDGGSTLVAYYGNESNYIFDQTIKHVKERAFYLNDSITDVRIPNGINWDTYPFGDIVGLKNVYFDDGVSVIPDYLMGYTSIEELTIPAHIKKVGLKSFYKTSLKSLQIEDNSSLSEIGKYSFSMNPELTMVKIGSSSSGYFCIIDEGAFFSCNSLDCIVVDDDFNLKSIGDGAFSKYNTVGIVSDDLSPIAINSTGTEKLIEIPNTVEHIGNFAFAAVKGGIATRAEPGLNTFDQVELKYQDARGYVLKFEEGSIINSIGRSSFFGLMNLSEIDLTNCTNLTEIGNASFRSVYDSVVIKWPDYADNETIKLMSIGDGSFEAKTIVGHASIPVDSMTIPATVQQIGVDAFKGITKKVDFEKDSEFIGSDSLIISPEYEIDLTNCKKISSIYCGSVITLPEGCYNIHGPSNVLNNIKNGENVLYENTSQTLQIGPNIQVINLAYLFGIPNDAGEFPISDIKEIQCDSKLFVYKDGLLSYQGKLILTSSEIKTLEIGEEDEIVSLGYSSLRNGNINKVKIDKNDFLLEKGAAKGTRAYIDYYFTKPDGIQLSKNSFEGSYGVPRFLVPNSVESSMINVLSSMGEVYKGYRLNDCSAYFPSVIDNRLMQIDVLSSNNNVLELKIKIPGGYTLHDVYFDSTDVEITSYKDSTIRVNLDSDAIVPVLLKDRRSFDEIKITFNGNGGTFGTKENHVLVLSRGLSILDSEIPVCTKSNSDFNGWYLNGEMYDFSEGIESDVTLIAEWTSRLPKILLDTQAGMIYCNNEHKKVIKDVQPDVSYTLSFEPYPGYEVTSWVYVIDNEVHQSDINVPLTLTNINSDVTVSTLYRYYAPSSGLIPVVNRGLPNTEELLSTTKMWELGGAIDQSGMAWKGHSSVPLIVDDYIYLRIGDAIYKFETDTGYVVAKASSVSTTSFYHQLGYGGGLIVDTFTSKVYDLDLKLLYTYDRSFTGVEYYCDGDVGYFYSSGTDVFRFKADSSVKDGHVVNTEMVGSFDVPIYSSYGFSMSVFKDGHIYRVYADGKERGIAAMRISDGKTSHYAIQCMDYMYLDDGWISIYENVIYLSAYTQGLFGAIAKVGSDELAYVKIGNDGLSFTDSGHYSFGDIETGFASQFVVSNGVGYIVASSSLYAFKMNADGTLGDVLNSKVLTYSHGSITIDNSYATEENGYLTYVYMIPYLTKDVSIAIMECYFEADDFVMNRVTTSHIDTNYCSQAVRAGMDGQMIWYNDSGHVLGYTTPEKNVYYFFVNDGENAGWYRAYGSNMYEAALTLGEIITINDSYDVSRMYGKQTSGATIIAVHSSVNSVMHYSWEVIDSFNNRDFDTDHYFMILANGISVNKGDQFSYVGGTYTFQENIGDRSLIGTIMVSGTDVSIVRFTEGGKELAEYTSVGKNGSNLNIIPRIVKEGYMPVWKLDGSVVDILSEKYSSDKEYKLEWMKIEQGIDSTVNSVTSKVSVVLANVKDDEISSLNIVMNITYADNTMSRVETSKLELRDGKVLVDFQYDSNKAVKDVMVYAEYNGIPICIDHPELA